MVGSESNDPIKGNVHGLAPPLQCKGLSPPQCGAHIRRRRRVGGLIQTSAVQGKAKDRALITRASPPPTCRLVEERHRAGRGLTSSTWGRRIVLLRLSTIKRSKAIRT